MVKVTANHHHQFERLQDGPQLIGLLANYPKLHSVALDWDLALASTDSPLRPSTELDAKLPELHYMSLRLWMPENIQDETIKPMTDELSMILRHIQHSGMKALMISLAESIYGTDIEAELQQLTTSMQTMRFPSLDYFQCNVLIDFDSLPSVCVWVSVTRPLRSARKLIGECIPSE